MAKKGILERIFGSSDDSGYGAEKGSSREASIARTRKANKKDVKKRGKRKTFGLIERMLNKRT